MQTSSETAMNAISIKNLTKIYKLYDKPVNRLKELIFKKTLHTPFTALDDLTFSVEKGETLGIIGENGAGKSTLLKILAGTLYPSWGEIKVNGRVSALLELGSGFHPEFSGLDNIYFYGSLLGIEKGLLEEKKKEIIEFSEIGDFIHYPLKTYSSGMYVRLAFSVATAIDPDILIVDEALSVGDLHFQKKSTDRILDMKEGGKTILFCSHEMYHIARLCDRVIWLKNGRIFREGKPLELIQEYETYQLGKNNPEQTAAEESTGDSGAAALAEEGFSPAGTERPVIFIKSVTTTPTGEVLPGSDLYVNIETHATDSNTPYGIAVKIRTVTGLDILGIGTDKLPRFYGDRKVRLFFPRIPLKSGTFIFEAFVFDAEGVYWYDRKEAPPVKVPRQSIEIGIVDLPHEWIVEDQ